MSLFITLGNNLIKCSKLITSQLYLDLNLFQIVNYILTLI